MKARRVGFTLLELIVVIVLLVALLLVMVPRIQRASEADGHATCTNHLKQIGLVFSMYAAEHGGKSPALSAIHDNWGPSREAIYPEYCTDPYIFVCPKSPWAAQMDFLSRPECLSSLYYIYTGYQVTTDHEAKTLFDSYHAEPRRVIAQSGVDLPEAPKGNDTYPEADPMQAKMPMVWERVYVNGKPSHDKPLGANVLYEDGHVEFKPCSENTFPITQAMTNTFGRVLPHMPAGCLPF